MPTYSRPHIGQLNGKPYNMGHSETISYETSKKVNGYYIRHLPCDHRKLISPGGTFIAGSNVFANWAFSEQIPWGLLQQYGRSQAHIGLDFQENNTFELLPFLADWDSTLAMFSKKFFRELSYGAVTWGVMPLLSDLSSLCNSLEDIRGGILQSYNKVLGKKISHRIPWTHKIDYGANVHTADGYTTIFGNVSGDIALPDSPAKAFAAFMDEIGFHPDLKTAWDVIPLSFVADYFLPIGDFLESLSPRGWFNPTFVVSGGYSVKFTVKQTKVGYDSCTWTNYLRVPQTLNLGSRPVVQPKFESPSFRELFNSLYLGTSLKKVF